MQTIVEQDRSTPVEIPDAAPCDVGAAAVALSYAIDALTASVKVGAGDAARHADKLVTRYREEIAEAGWKFHGIVELANGARGWRVVPR